MPFDIIGQRRHGGWRSAFRGGGKRFERTIWNQPSYGYPAYSLYSLYYPTYYPTYTPPYVPPYVFPWGYPGYPYGYSPYGF